MITINIDNLTDIPEYWNPYWWLRVDWEDRFGSLVCWNSQLWGIKIKCDIISCQSLKLILVKVDWMWRVAGTGIRGRRQQRKRWEGLTLQHPCNIDAKSWVLPFSQSRSPGWYPVFKCTIESVRRLNPFAHWCVKPKLANSFPMYTMWHPVNRWCFIM